MQGAIMRRLPQQARGQRRIEAILDAAEEVLVESGFEGATTNAIAAKADTSIGSIYQFFPNKEAILEALGMRYTKRMEGMFSELLGEEAVRLPPVELVRQIIDALDGMQQASPAFKVMFCGKTPVPALLEAVPALLEAEDALHSHIIGGVARILAQRAPWLAPDHIYLYATISVKIVEAVMPVLAETAGTRRALVLQEMKRLLLAYISPLLVADGPDIQTPNVPQATPETSDLPEEKTGE